MNKKIILGFLLIAFFIGIGTLLYSKRNNTANQTSPTSDKINIVVTFYPLQYFAEQIGGNLVNVLTLTPAGGEPHDYEPSPQDIVKIRNSDLFVLNGANFEPWTNKVISQISTEKIKVLNMSEKIDLLHSQETEEDHDEKQGEEPEHGEFDPHLWLDPTNAQKEAIALKEVLSSLDAQNASYYEANANTLIKLLQNLQTEFDQGLVNCQKREIISSHNAFQYLAHRFNFTVSSIAGLSPDQDPSPKHIAELSKLVSSKNIQYIFTETLASPKFVNTLANETKVHTLVLNPIEGLTEQDLQQKKDYISLMRENLHNLQIAMECK